MDLIFEETFASKVYRHFSGDQFHHQKLFFRYEDGIYPIRETTPEYLKYGDNNWCLYSSDNRYRLYGVAVKRSLLGLVVTLDMGDKQ